MIVESKQEFWRMHGEKGIKCPLSQQGISPCYEKACLGRVVWNLRPWHDKTYGLVASRGAICEKNISFSQSFHMKLWPILGITNSGLTWIIIFAYYEIGSHCWDFEALPRWISQLLGSSRSSREEPGFILGVLFWNICLCPFNFYIFEMLFLD